MRKYSATLQKHLGQYAATRLGVTEHGVFKGGRYPHILPSRLRYLNLLESSRAEIQTYLAKHPEIKLHQYFHHLNSSQAFAFNLFYPYFAADSAVGRVLAKALGVNADVGDWKFEFVPDSAEGTNVDVFWFAGDGVRVFCEVKLSESEFGQAKDDPRHQKKLETIYTPRLNGLVSEKLLAPKTFFKHYQLLRNISLLSDNPRDRLIFLMPGENESLKAPLQRVLENALSQTRRRIHVSYVEDCIESLENSRNLPPALLAHAGALREKYVI